MLIKYLPEFLQEVKEFKTIMEVSEPFIKNINEETENCLKDMFILESTEKGVKHYEQMLNITPNFDSDLYSRKFEILCKYNEKLPYTYINLKSMLNNLVGENSYQMDVSVVNSILNIKLTLKNKYMLQSVTDLLERVVPLNIVLNISLLYNTWGDLKPYTWGSLNSYTWKELKEGDL